MRLLLVSDLHYTLPQLDWVVDVAPEFDVVVMAGDHLDISSRVAVNAQTAVMLEYLSLLARTTATIIASSGNHDLTGPDENGEQSALWIEQARDGRLVLDGDSIVVGDTLITVCKWWDGPVGRDAIEAQLARDASRRTGRWIWVYHWPPLGSPTCWTGKRSYGDEDLGRWIGDFHPDMVLAGHVHQPPFVRDGAWADCVDGTWVFNPGRQVGPVPAHIEIDLDAGEASWASMLGREVVQLAERGTPARTVF